MSTVRPDYFYTQIDVFPTLTSPQAATATTIEPSSQLCGLLRELISSQGRQTALLEELVATATHPQRRRTVELGMWKISNPELAEYCKRAAKKLERIQTDLLSTITEEIERNADMLFESEFGLSEFIDRFVAKFLQLNSLLQVLAQLGNAPDLQVPPAEIRKDN